MFYEKKYWSYMNFVKRKKIYFRSHDKRITYVE